MKSKEGMQSPELDSLLFERCREILSVPAPRRFSLLVEDQITGVQTIPFMHDGL